MSAFNYKRCAEITEAHRTAYFYLDAELAAKVIDSIMSNRRKQVCITADFAPAFKKHKIPFNQERGYAVVAYHYFNLKGTLVKNGSGWSLYKKK